VVTVASEPIRDPLNDHLLTPNNSAFVICDLAAGICWRLTPQDMRLETLYGVALVAPFYSLGCHSGSPARQNTKAIQSAVSVSV
jgi:hypothetical protein